MAHSIPQNLGRGNISLKNKTKRKNKIKGQMNKKKRRSHIPNRVLKTKVMSVTQKWHVKSTLWEKDNINKKTTMSIKKNNAITK
jgi:cell division protein FtsB